jgi:hypothetical protein
MHAIPVNTVEGNINMFGRSIYKLRMASQEGLIRAPINKRNHISILCTHWRPVCLCGNLTYADVHVEMLWEKNTFRWLKCSSSEQGLTNNTYLFTTIYYYMDAFFLNAANNVSVNLCSIMYFYVWTLEFSNYIRLRIREVVNSEVLVKLNSEKEKEKENKF